jgi:nucleotidyltransferase substrate binding protein (TIGR01987 family)
MEKLEIKGDQLVQALMTLQKSIENFKKIEQSKESISSYISYDDAYRMARDSMVQRFEYCTDLFWKYLKKKSEAVTGSQFEFAAPTPVVRHAYSIGLISEDEAHNALEMIKDRNLTSHIYKEEIAEQLSAIIPDYCVATQKIVQRLTNR